jgi:hypothetical protein
LRAATFKGAALYYLHDKRGDGEADRLTAERVTWTETVNLPSTDPERAWRMMAHTAMSQAALKAASGKKATGRKLTKPVLAYSLAWHPDERPGKAEQIDAARASLKALGLDEHQALIVCHDDEPHAHVHVLVNRVHPTTGIAATLSNSKLALSKWAEAYEKARGPVLCPQRATNNAMRQKGQYIRDARLPRPVFEFNRAAANDDLSAEFVRADQAQKDALLHAMGRTLKESHARQWASLKATYAGMRAKLAAHEKALIAAKAAEIKDGFKPQWRALFGRQRAERQMFEAAETGFLTRLFNMAVTWRELRRHHEYEGDGSRAVWAALSGRRRQDALAARQERERRALAHAVTAAVRAETSSIRQHGRQDMDRLRGQFLGQCMALHRDQDRQWAEMKAAWKTRAAERRLALRPYLDRHSRGQGHSFHAARHLRDGQEFSWPPKPAGPGESG